MTRVCRPEVTKALDKAHSVFPQEWQAEAVEIAMIPAVRTAIRKANRQPFKLRRVKNKFGPGYVLEGWNSLRDEYYSHNPSTTYNGIGREFYGYHALEQIRSWAHGFTNKDARCLRLTPKKGKTVEVHPEP